MRWGYVVVVVVLLIAVLLAGCLHGGPGVNETENTSGEGDSNMTNRTGEDDTDTQTDEADYERPTEEDYRQGFNKMYPASGSEEYHIGASVGKIYIGAVAEFSSNSEKMEGEYRPQGLNRTETIDAGMDLSNETLMVKYGGNWTEIDGVTIEDRGKVFDVEMDNRTTWRYDSFAPELTEILNSDKELVDTGYSAKYNLRPDKEVVADYVNKQFLMFTGRTPFNLSAEKINSYDVTIQLVPDRGRIPPGREHTYEPSFRPEIRMVVRFDMEGGEGTVRHNMIAGGYSR